VRYDACFFCLGVSVVGMREAEYRRVTYDITMAAARAVPDGITFVYVSGTGIDSTEQGASMWARVKGRTENALLASPLDAYMFRPAWLSRAGTGNRRHQCPRPARRVERAAAGPGHRDLSVPDADVRDRKAST
jgi:uncharacterized protein YbjT (DUF2867 family)